MSEAYTGGCACGAIRYEKAGAPIAALHCQCRQCQQRSGTGHASYVVLDRREDLIVQGELKSWPVAGDSGNVKHNAFCPICGSPVFVTFEAMPEVIAIHVGSLDDPSRFCPGMVTYAARAQQWDRVGPCLKSFAEMPPG